MKNKKIAVLENKEIMTEVKTFLVELECNICGEGTMEYTSEVFTQLDTFYLHKCSNCGGLQKVTNKTYPHTKTEKIKNGYPNP